MRTKIKKNIVFGGCIFLKKEDGFAFFEAKILGQFFVLCLFFLEKNITLIRRNTFKHGFISFEIRFLVTAVNFLGERYRCGSQSFVRIARIPFSPSDRAVAVFDSDI